MPVTKPFPNIYLMGLNCQMDSLMALSPPCLSLQGKREGLYILLCCLFLHPLQNVAFLALDFDVKLEQS